MKNNIPKGSLIEGFLPADHCDVHTYKVEAESLKADDIQVAFWNNSPKWVRNLMRLRNSIVKFMGLKGEQRDADALERCIRNGGTYSLFTVAAKLANENILRLDDSHLSAQFLYMFNPCRAMRSW